MAGLLSRGSRSLLTVSGARQSISMTSYSEYLQRDQPPSDMVPGSCDSAGPAGTGTERRTRVRGRPLGQVVQHDVFREEVTRARRPGYRIQPHSPASPTYALLSGPDDTDHSGVGCRTGADLGVRDARVTRAGSVSASAIRTRVRPGQPGEPGAQPDARLLGDENQVRRTTPTAPGRQATASPRTSAVVAGPGHPGHRPAGRQRPRAPQRYPRMRAGHCPPPQRRHAVARATAAPHRLLAAPFRVHQVRRPHRATASRTTHRHAHPVPRSARGHHMPNASSPVYREPGNSSRQVPGVTCPRVGGTEPGTSGGGPAC